MRWSVCKEVGLEINRAKSKYMVEGIPDSDYLHSIDGTRIKLSDDFKNLGSWTKVRTKVRKAKAWSACHGLS